MPLSHAEFGEYDFRPPLRLFQAAKLKMSAAIAPREAVDLPAIPPSYDLNTAGFGI